MLKIVFAGILFLGCHAAVAQHFYLFIGTFTGPEGGEGIYVYDFNSADGSLLKVSSTTHLVNPSFITLAPGGKHLYACTESKMPGAGSVSSFSFNDTTGTLTFLNKQSSGGENPVYLSVHKSNRWLVNGNYTEGSITVYPLNKDGSIAPFCQRFGYNDSSIVRERQESAHLHATVFSHDGNFLFVPDLGSDKIRSYTFDSLRSEPLRASPASFTPSIPGSGPRHFTFHPDNRFAYCIEELSGTVSAYRYENGMLQFLQRISAHDTIFHGPYAGADIHVSPDGKFLYASNRGEENTIAIFSIDTTNGMLSTEGYHSTLGVHPRNFIIDPTGNFLLVANVTTNNVVVLKRDQQTGMLSPSGTMIEIYQPSCLQMLKLAHE